MRRALAALLCAVPGAALAHAPVVRSAVPLADGATLVTVPGFGVVLGAEDTGFAYLCDAALGSVPSADDYTVHQREDGALLIGTGAGLRIRSPELCPLPDEADSELHDTPVSRLTGAAGGPVYAALGGPLPRLARSDDGGRRWRTLMDLPAGLPATDVVLAGDEVTVSVGAPLAAQRARWREHDGRARVEAVPDGLRVLAAGPGGAPPFWGLVRAEGNVTRGAWLARATSLDEPFQRVLYVDYFGGFGRAASGALWVGDAGGHLYRSTDDGATFVDVAAGLGAACVAPGQAGVDACQLSSPRKPALSRYDDEAGALRPILALAEVDRLVTCPGFDVAAVCANAWSEWNRDARLLAAVDGGAPEDAAPSSDAGLTDDAGAVPADADDAPAAGANAQRGTGGCALGATPARLPLWPACLLALALHTRRRRVSA